MSTYLDHAATTPVDPEILDSIRTWMADPLNPSSVHRHGQKARALLEEAREEIAFLLGFLPSQVVFTSSATEANNLAIRGLAAGRFPKKKTRVLTSPIEHSCVRETLSALESLEDVEIEQMPVDSAGRAVIPAPGAQRPNLFCLMHAQNETGVVQRIEEARRFRDETGCLWLCDITQTLGICDCRIETIGADLVSASSHKLYGPSGAGLLAGPGLESLLPQITGGPQEHEMRAGTQPVAAILGFVQAACKAANERARRREHLQRLEEALMGKLQTSGLDFHHNGAGADRLPGFLNLSFPGIGGPDLLIALDSAGYSISSGSACATGVMEPSKTLLAMFPDDPDRAAEAIRITPGKGTLEDEILRFGHALIEAVERLRKD